jgi:hypothetical protein
MVLVLAGCGGGRQTATNSVSLEPIKTSGSKPGWVSDDRTFWVEDGRFKFRVVAENERGDLAQANMGLTTQMYSELSRVIKTRVGVEFDEATRGSKYDANSLGQMRQQVVNSMSDVKFSDLVKEREYWEQYERNAAVNTVEYVYTAYGLYSISEIEVARAKEEAWKKASEVRAADKDAKQILDEAKARFLGRE